MQGAVAEQSQKALLASAAVGALKPTTHGAVTSVNAERIAKDRGIGGPILSASRYFMKSPPVQYNDSQAKQAVEDFIAGTIES